MREPGGRSVEPDPDERDEHAYEDTWYRALKVHSDHLQKDPPSPDEDDTPEDG